jgi:hypothetical protein
VKLRKRGMRMLFIRLHTNKSAASELFADS